MDFYSELADLMEKYGAEIDLEDTGRGSFAPDDEIVLSTSKPTYTSVNLGRWADASCVRDKPTGDKM